MYGGASTTAVSFEFTRLSEVWLPWRESSPSREPTSRFVFLTDSDMSSKERTPSRQRVKYLCVSLMLCLRKVQMPQMFTSIILEDENFNLK